MANPCRYDWKRLKRGTTCARFDLHAEGVK
jgi:hypothetical protein